MLKAAVLLLILAEQEDLADPANRRWLAYCQEKAAYAAILCLTGYSTDITSQPG